MNGSTHENQKICVSQECNGIGKIKGIAKKAKDWIIGRSGFFQTQRVWGVY